MRITQRKGDIAVSQAIATFTKLGYDVLIPLTESLPYDLAVDIQGTVVRIQVKYTSSLTGEVDLRNIHSNAQGYVVKKYIDGSFDWLYVLKSNGEEFLIKDNLSSRRSVRPKQSQIICNVLAVAE
jgi:hypothetical protein